MPVFSLGLSWGPAFCAYASLEDTLRYGAVILSSRRTKVCMQKLGIFISYRREDSAKEADRLYVELSERLVSTVFLDIDSIAPGEEFPQALDTALASSDVVLAIIGDKWLTLEANGRRRLRDPNDYVRREIAVALGRNVHIIPVLVRGAKMPPADELPEELVPLSFKNAISLGSQTFRPDIVRLARRLAAIVPPSRLLPDEGAASLLAERAARWQHDKVEKLESECVQRLRVAGFEPRLVIQEGLGGAGHARSRGAQYAVAFSPNGKMVASAGDDELIRTWQIETGTLLRTYAGHVGEVRSVCYSPDGNWIASGGSDKTVRVWDRWTGEAIHCLEGHPLRIECVEFTPDGQVILSGGGDIRLWDAGTGELVLRINDHPFFVGMSPDGNTIASLAHDGLLKLWDRCSGSLIRSVQAQAKNAGALLFALFNSRGSQIVTGGCSPSLKIWDVATGRYIRSIETDIDTEKHPIHAAAMSSDDKWIAVTDDQECFEIWDAVEGRRTFRLDRQENPLFTSVRFSPDSSMLAGGCRDDSVRILDVKGAMLGKLGGARHRTAIVIAPDRNTVLLGVDMKSCVIWDAAERAPLSKLAAGDFRTADFSPNSRFVAVTNTCNYDREVYEITGRKVAELPDCGSKGSLAFSPDSGLLAAICEPGRQTARVEVHRTSTSKLAGRIRPLLSAPTAVTFDPEHGFLGVGCSDGTIELWEPETRQLVGELKGYENEVHFLSFQPGGRNLASASQSGHVLLWDVPDRCLLGAIGTDAGGKNRILFSPDGSILACQSKGNDSIELWDVVGGELLRSITAFRDIQSFAFSSDGRTLAVTFGFSSYDSVTSLVSVASGQLAVMLRGFADGHWVAFEPSGHYTASADSLQHISWRLCESVFHSKSLFEEYYYPDVLKAAK